METTATTSSAAAANYAGFGQRLLAFIIDYVILYVVYLFIATPVLAMVGLSVANEAQGNPEAFQDPEAAMGIVGTVIAAVMSMMLVFGCLIILYFSLMESMATQGTLGKMAMGIKVVDLQGNRISFGKALLRSLGRIINGFIMYIGYLMAAFTEKKQGLHDMIAGTLVVKR